MKNEERASSGNKKRTGSTAKSYSSKKTSSARRPASRSYRTRDYDPYEYERPYRRPAKRRKKKKNPVVTLFLWVIAIVAAFLLSSYLKNNVFELVKVSSDAMYSTMENGDIVVVSKKAYDNADISRGDIVAIRSGKGIILRRVIGMPGETVEVIDGETYIDQEKFFENYIFRDYENYESRTVSADRYYVMCDNRTVTFDSRDMSVGLISEKDILGRASYIVWPFSHYTTF